VRADFELVEQTSPEPNVLDMVPARVARDSLCRPACLPASAENRGCGLAPRRRPSSPWSRNRAAPGRSPGFFPRALGVFHGEASPQARRIDEAAHGSERIHGLSPPDPPCKRLVGLGRRPPTRRASPPTRSLSLSEPSGRVARPPGRPGSPLGPRAACPRLAVGGCDASPRTASDLRRANGGARRPLYRVLHAGPPRA